MILRQSVKVTQSQGGKSFQQTVLRKLDVHMQKNEVGSLPNTIYED